MQEAFLDLLREAGPWTSCLTLRDTTLKRSTNTLVVSLTAQAPVSQENRSGLLAILKNRFSGYEIELEITAEQAPTPSQIRAAAPAAVKAAEKPAARPKDRPAGRENASMPVQAQPSAGKWTLIYGKPVQKYVFTAMDALREDSGRVTVQGEIITTELKTLRGDKGNALLMFSVSDHTNTVSCKLFIEQKKGERLLEKLEGIKKEGGILMVRGDCRPDSFAHYELVITAYDIMTGPKEQRMDTAAEKRVELHLHTQMSSMDGLTRVKAAVKTAARWGHAAIAITDHGVVQAFPEATKACKDAGIKPLYGVEGYLIRDTELYPLDNRYVVFDVETTGLRADVGHLLEIGAVKLEHGKVTGRFSSLIDPGVPISPKITELTGITNEMVSGQPATAEVLQQFRDFCEDCVLVGHNASFDVGFVRVHGARYGLEFKHAYADTLMLSRYLLKDMKNHKLDTVCERLGISLENHHRAVDDAGATAEAFIQFMSMLKERGVEHMPVTVWSAEQEQQTGKRGKARPKTYHIIILAKTQQGMYNLYKIVSHAHLDFLHTKPQIPWSLLSMFREGLILGSACVEGELFQAMLRGESEEALQTIARRYDYLEIQPIGNNAFLLREGKAADEEALREYNRRILQMGRSLDIPVAATGDVHFLEPEDAQYRAILMSEMGFEDADEQAPLYFKTTDEMLEEFSYLGEEDALDVVVTTPNAIAAKIEQLKPYPDGTHAPVIPDAENILKNMALDTAHAKYGDPLPETVQKRLDKELNSIITNGFASLYLMAQRLVQKSLSDGYLVGSRGSVGSSLVATMAGITEVNALPPHYVCPNCKHSDFDTDREKYSCGVDMPDKTCPNCGTPYRKEGFEIPFEVFLGFKGDKTPDIDLNFSGEYQPVAHKFTETMMGPGHAFRAGTISAVQDKTVYGYVMKYLEKHGRTVSRAEVDRLCAGISGVKRTTGQHPGGIVVVPKERDIFEFTPIQYPADQKEKNTITTHFDFHALDDRLVKLDILGHDDPTALRMLQDMTGIDPRTIPLDDPETLKLYSSMEPLGVDLSALSGTDVGSLGLPEFGTGFVRQMLKDTRPTTMEELVRIAGLSHGTDVWLNNAQDLVKDGTATLSEVICTRDDIMNYLIAHGVESSMAFKTMESVRKGRGLKDEMRAAMEEQHIPQWFITSCEKIKYMFPRGHAVAYVMMSFRIAYYKMHYPKEFYAVYYTVRADSFDVQYAVGGAETVLKNIQTIEKKGKEASNLEKDLVTILEVVYEMNLRGIELLPVSIYKSQATRFVIEGNAIRPPFSAVSGVGENAAVAMAEAIEKRGGKPFVTIEEFASETKANSGVVTALEAAGCFGDMPKNNQISLFSF